MKILFVIHEDSRSGAPMAVLNLQHALKLKKDIQYATYFILKTGQILPEFKKINKTVHVARPPHHIGVRLSKRILGRNPDHMRFIKLVSDFDVVILATCVSLTWMPEEFFTLPVKRILLLYEMPVAMKIMNTDISRLSKVDLIFSPTQSHETAVQEMSTAVLPIRRLNQLILDEGSTFHTGENELSEKYFWVGMIGSTGWAKGIENFIAIAAFFRKKYPQLPVKFIWKGVNQSSAYSEVYTSEVIKADISDSVFFEGQTETTYAFYQKINVLELTSREDTYPNVMLEAALWEKPTVCFQKSGGAEDFVKAGAGITVPYLDLEAYCDALYTYYENPEKRAIDGKTAKAFTEENHCNPLLAQEQFLTGLKSILKR